jgi:hypothetical protein
MSATALRFVVLVAIALTACGKSEQKKADAATPSAQSQTKIYGREDGECFAGILRLSDEKKFTAADLRNWRDQLNSKDKEWFNATSIFYANAAKTANAHLGSSPKQLHESNVITLEQYNLIEGYLDVYQDKDSLKASDKSASACVKLGFTKGLDLSWPQESKK